MNKRVKHFLIFGLLREVKNNYEVQITKAFLTNWQNLLTKTIYFCDFMLLFSRVDNKILPDHYYII
jgi:hypothetical protein